MTPKRRSMNLSWFFYLPLLQQISTDQIIEFKQVLTRPSVAKTDCRFFSVLMFHETVSN